MNDALAAQLDHRQRTLLAVQEMLVTDLYMECEPRELDPDAALFGSGHGLDSIDAVELLVALEGKFGIRMQEERVLAVRHLRTINSIVDRLLEPASEGSQ